MIRVRGLGYKYKEPPPTLVVVYRDKPIAELEQAPPGKQYRYVFRYLSEFQERALPPFPGLPLRMDDQHFIDLPTYFEERLPDPRRPDIRDLMIRLKLSPDNTLQLLARLGSHTITDPFEFRLKRVAS